MSEPWTPGPWRWADGKYDPDTDTGDVDSGLVGPSWTHPADRIIECNYTGEFSVPNPADARLIALAPEMAAFIETVSIVDEDYGHDCPYANEAAAILTRARGEE